MLRRAYQVKLPEAEAAAFDAFVRRRSLATTGSPDELSAAAVLRSIIRAAIDADETAAAPATPKGAKRSR